MKCYGVESGGWTVVVWYLVSEMLRNRIRWVDCDGIVSGQ